jgi:CSLREA domain-containing protein
MSRRTRLVANALASMLFLGGLPLQAATLHVTKTVDTADGACDADCSLREAIIAANAAGAATTIVLPSGTYILTLAGTGEDAAAKGDLDLTGTATLIGAGAAVTVVDADRIDRVFHVRSGAVVSITGVTVRNGAVPTGNGGGILNEGTLTLTDVRLDHNDAFTDPVYHPGVHSGDGGAIFNAGTLSLTGVTVSNNNNTRVEVSPSGAIFNARDATLTLTNSSVTGNGNINTCVGSAVYNEGTFVANNSTFSGNLGTSVYCIGTAVLSNGTTATVALNNTTITDNIPAGVSRAGGAFTIQNSLIARNGTTGTSDCPDSLSLHSLGFNLIGAASCTVESAAGDQIGTPTFPIDPKLGQLIGFPRYQPLLAGSKAIDAGNPAGCAGSAGVLVTDQRGAPRVGRCDIGSYEFTVPEAPAVIFTNAGAPQHAGPLTAFRTALQAAVVDRAGSPVRGVAVKFTAPESGPSATFANAAGVTTALTNDSGLVSATLAANAVLGSYDVAATVSGISAPALFPLTNLVWYAAAGGDAGANCLSPGTACAGPAVVLAKDGFVSGDTILVGAGTYTGTGPDQVVLIIQDARLSGGWTKGFTAQSGASIVDGQNARGGITLASANRTTVVIQRFMVRNGFSRRGGGIHIGGGVTLSLEESTIEGNSDDGDGGGGIANEGTLTLTATTVSGNKSRIGAGGIYNFKTLTVRNSTISGNAGGIVNLGFSTATVNNSTVTANSAVGISNNGGTVTLRNSIVAANASAADCSGVFISDDYNVIGSNARCSFTPKDNDRVGTETSPLDPLLWPLQNNGGPTFTHALKTDSPAINAGNPSTPGSGGSACEARDQRGVPRTRCDAGAFQSLRHLRSVRP